MTKTNRRVTLRNAAGEVIQSRHYFSETFALSEYVRQQALMLTEYRPGWTVELGP